jgi:glycosyltransferase involved in cell wall biosynthesis
VGLALNYLSFMISSSIRVITLKKDFDIIFVYQLSPITLALPGVVLKMITKKPLYLYCLDIWPESAKTLLKNGDSIIFKLIKVFSTFIYSHCDHISVTSQPFVEYFVKEHKIASEKISILQQQGNDDYYNMDFTPNDKCVDFVFMGNIGIAQDLETIFKAVEGIREVKNFKVHLVGDGSFMEKSKQYVYEKGIENLVVFHGKHAMDEMPKFYKIADACLLTLNGSNLVGNTIPSKLQGYMSAGKPVLAAINGSANELIVKSKCGACVDAGDSIGLSALMLDFIENPGKYAAAGENGRKYYYTHFTEKVFLENLNRNLNQLLET